MKRNPFRARQICPGRLPYLFPEGHEIAPVIGRFISSGLRGQIVGPHGTGKSTLLQNVANELRQREYQVRQVAIGPNTPRLLRPLRLMRRNIDQLHRDIPVRSSEHALSKQASGNKRVITIDGCEMASWWERFRFFGVARRAGWGVLITAHRDMGFPTLWETCVTVETARRIVKAMIALEYSSGEATEQGELVVPDELVEQLLSKHNGNMREVLFSLYDRCRV